MCNIPDPPQVNVVIYHKDCSDGFGSAMAAWLLLGYRAQYYPALHGDAPPPNLAGKHIVVCDFAYPRATTIKLMEEAASMVTIDHHDTSATDLQGLPNCIFDNTRSGAVLTWIFFHGLHQTIPRLFLHIQDRDLWQFALPDTKSLMTKMDQLPQTFETWLRYCNPMDPVASERNLQRATVEGRPVAVFIQSEIEKLGKRGVVRMMKGHPVVVLNCSQWINEVGSFMAQRNHIHFAVVWFYDHARKFTKVSLRSSKNTDLHLGRFCTQHFSGGGHATSAAFKWYGPIEELFDREVKTYVAPPKRPLQIVGPKEN